MSEEKKISLADLSARVIAELNRGSQFLFQGLAEDIRRDNHTYTQLSRAEMLREMNDRAIDEAKLAMARVRETVVYTYLYQNPCDSEIPNALREIDYTPVLSTFLEHKLRRVFYSEGGFFFVFRNQDRGLRYDIGHSLWTLLSEDVVNEAILRRDYRPNRSYGHYDDAKAYQLGPGAQGISPSMPGKPEAYPPQYTMFIDQKDKIAANWVDEAVSANTLKIRCPGCFGETIVADLVFPEDVDLNGKMSVGCKYKCTVKVREIKRRMDEARKMKQRAAI